jgi:hypothetical protein
MTDDIHPVIPDVPAPDAVELLRSLWALTPENLRGKLPKPYKKDAEKGQCKDCGGYHGLPAMHLDYLGHADTCRLIAEKDILWQWEPKGGWEPNGEPVFVRNNGGYPIALWIDLTICGVTRPGVGTVTTGKGDPEKELIGDAIRNAAMRFGVGADMWSKAHHAEIAAEDGTERTYTRASAAPAGPPPPKTEGWDSAAQEAEAHKDIGNRLAQLPEDHPVRIAGRVMREKHGWPVALERLAELRNLLDEAERAPLPHQDDEKAPSAPEPTDTPDAPSLPLPEPEKPKPARRPGPLVKCAWCGTDIKDEAAIPVSFEGKPRTMHGKCKTEYEAEKAANPDEPF